LLNLKSLSKVVPCDRIKKIRVGENGGLNQSKHQNHHNPGNSIFLFDRTLLYSMAWQILLKKEVVLSVLLSWTSIHLLQSGNCKLLFGKKMYL
jgi:hypothetical protein